MLPTDFSGNPVSPPGGWPLSYAELQPFYRAAEQSLHVRGDKLTGSQAPRLDDLEGKAPVDISQLRAFLTPLGLAVDYPPVSSAKGEGTGGDPVRFARDVLPGLSQKANVRMVSNATASRILADRTGRVTGIQVRSATGDVSKLITAKRYVIACGAVESTRLLLLSQNEAFPTGIGNHSDQLGRNFMEHPFISYVADVPGLNPFDHWQVGRTYQFCQPLWEQGLGGAVLAFYGEQGKPGQLKIALGIEMAPHADNRIRLAPERVDPLGNPGADLHLGFSDSDQRLLVAGEAIVHDIFARLKSGGITRLADVHWSHHHMGSTRMSRLPRDGVVDPDLRVHGTDNLYVLSSSVFVTAGVANPTLTITAFAHRLCEHLLTLTGHENA